MSLIKKAKFLLWIFLTSSLFAGIEDIDIDLQLLNNNAQVFVIGDFRNSLSTNSYFMINLANNGNEQVRMKLRVEIYFNNVLIAWAESSVFNFPGNTVLPPYSNLQLSQGVMIPGSAPPYNIITLGEFDVDLNAVENLENQILATGKLPSGVYRFQTTGIEILSTGEEGEHVSDPFENHTLIITNPTTLELFFPGRSISETTIEEIATTFPYFQWQTDVYIDINNEEWLNNDQPPYFNIFVYEKFPEDETTQDVLSHPAILQIEKYKLNFFQYPLESNPILQYGTAVGPIRLLENGKTYYWYIESVILTGTGDYTIQSDVFRFRIADLTESVNYAPQILALLEQILGPNYWPVLQQLRDDGFDPNGKIFLEKNEIDINELLIILGKLTRGEAEVKDVEVY